MTSPTGSPPAWSLPRIGSCRGCTVIVLAGVLDHTATGDLAAAVIASAPACAPRVVLDLAAVSFCDSSGIAAVIETLRALHARDGRLVLARPRPQTRQLIARLALARFLIVHDTLETAITSLSRPARS
ncbi:STAS domain-containing protein [Actinomadura sp. 21ATH]|uniref:STAS domain-containing protein n=1 Tax=Actinomadura sp. 21ATH TaxID=1735444 RepID=UPI0035BFAE7D